MKQGSGKERLRTGRPECHGASRSVHPRLSVYRWEEGSCSQLWLDGIPGGVTQEDNERASVREDLPSTALAHCFPFA